MPLMKPLGKALLAGMAVLAVSTAAAQTAGQFGQDFVVLVDVSSSMHEHSRGGRPEPGSDPQRLRWDAVKLVLDLLTDDDRLLVLPFNADCPAQFRFSPQNRVPIPGVLDPEMRLHNVDDAFRAQLDARLRRFIHDRNKMPAAKATEANMDWGETGILNALGVAGDKIATARTDAQRKVVVILLTDGREETSGTVGRTDPDEQLVDTGRWTADPRIQRFVRERIPVYTFGLGELADKRFLQELAALTGGKSTLLKTNLELVEQFRELVWSLRNCWIASVDAAAFRVAGGQVSSRPLGGIRDFAVLMYEVDRSQQRPNQPRITFAPDPLPILRWQNLDGRPEPADNHRAGKEFATRTADGHPGPVRASGYVYYYFDGRDGLFRQSPGPELKLDLGEFESRHVKSAADLIHGYFIKRGPRFESRLVGNRFYRHQPIPLRVVMTNLRPGDDGGKYKVYAKLSRAGVPKPDVQVTLEAVSPYEFVCRSGEFSAASLPPSEGPGAVEDYVVRVMIEEATSSAPRYRHELPPRDIGIENVVLLKPVPPVTLNRSTPQQSVTIETVYPFQGRLPLHVERRMPAAEGSGVPLDAAHFQFAWSPRSGSDTEATLEDGKLSLDVGLKTDNPPKKGRYVNGLVQLTTGAGAKFAIRTLPEPGSRDFSLTQLAVPISVELGAVGVRLTSPASLAVGPGRPEAAASVKVTAAPGQRTVGLRPLSVEVVRADTGQVAFAASELWIDGGAGGTATKRQTCMLKSLPGAGLRIVFRPDPARHPASENLIGRHRYVVRVKGEDIDPAEHECWLEVRPPDRLHVVYPQLTPEILERFPGLPFRSPQRVSRIALQQPFDRPLKVTLGLEKERAGPLEPDRVDVVIEQPQSSARGRGPRLVKSEQGDQSGGIDFLPPPRTAAADVRRDPATGRLWIAFHFPAVSNASQDSSYYVNVLLRYREGPPYREPTQVRVRMDVNFFDAAEMVGGAVDK
jgi:hypothetical protein